MANGRAAGRLQTATHRDFAREVKVSYPISYRYSMSTNPSFESDLPEALDRSLSSFPEVKSLKAEQRLVIEKVVQGRDVFDQLPTGFGKSLTFQILPPLCKCLKSMGHNFPSKPLVVIVSPLLSIMEDQVKWLRSRGFAAAYIGEKAMTKTVALFMVRGISISSMGVLSLWLVTVGSGICSPRTFTGRIQLPLSVMRCILLQ